MLFIIVIDMHTIFIARKKEGNKVGGLITYLVDGGGGELASSSPTYLLDPWRQALAASAGGGRCHMLPGQLAATREVVIFVNFAEKWSFLTFH
jgi:hypothetical protein